MTSADIGRLIARAWSDEAFLSKLQLNPDEALKDCGLTAPPGLAMHVHANTATDVHIVIPARPRAAEAAPPTTEAGGGCHLHCRGNNSW